MIHILLMILKIIGIILLVILGILLVLILAVLFVPVRYKADFSWHGEPDLSPVSYTHLDVYKRQHAALSATPRRKV